MVVGIGCRHQCAGRDYFIAPGPGWGGRLGLLCGQGGSRGGGKK